MTFSEQMDIKGDVITIIMGLQRTICIHKQLQQIGGLKLYKCIIIATWKIKSAMTWEVL